MPRNTSESCSRRRFLKLLGSSSLAGVVLAACGSASNVSTPQPTAAPAPATGSTAATQPAAGAAATAAPTTAPTTAATADKFFSDLVPTPVVRFDPVVEITTYFPSGATFNKGDDYENNPITRRLRQHLGVQHKIHSQGGWDAYQADIAANNLPDLWRTGVGDITLLHDNGAIEDITDIWENTASPLVKQKKGYPDAKMWYAVRFDNRIFGVPFWWGPKANTESLGWIRQDWLEKIGKPVPTTIDELTTVLTEFKKQGLAEYPLATTALDPIYGAFGSVPRLWLKASDGTIEYGSLRPGVKDALGVLAGWYKAGLMHPEYYNSDQGAQILNEQSGVAFNAWWIYSDWVIQELFEKKPDAKWINMALPKGPGGLSGRAGGYDVGPAMVFKKGTDPKKIEAAIQQLNWNMDMHVNWTKYKQYGEWRNGSGWGYGYDIVEEGGKLKPGSLQKGTRDFVDGVGFHFPAIAYPDYQLDVITEMEKWVKQDPSTLDMGQRYLIENPKVLHDITAYRWSIDAMDKETTYRNEFYGQQTKRMAALEPTLGPMEDTFFTEIITGQRPVSAFDEFVSTWMSEGGKDMIADVNAWYKSLSS